MISNDKYISFFIENFNDIESLNEIAEQAKSKIPVLLDQEIKNYISEIGDMTSNVDVHIDKKEIWWCDPGLYDSEQGKGPFFGYESHWGSLFSGNDPADASYLYMCVDIGDIKQIPKKKEYIDNWINKLKAASSRLKQSNIISVMPVDYQYPYILKYPLHREVNMVSIANREKLKISIQAAIKSFTSTTLSILNNADKVGRIS
jgi:hypothetical protein